ncbi:jg20018 [Pararge aegeria aegeria]|uniref:Jg20018 protein n=1 Tax=Pararge aegeria aegeria TaxID=348720 RepID=A0A8S4R7E8_9NEOP|nr:jg20018 [Pararge aegeria aegeria]
MASGLHQPERERSMNSLGEQTQIQANGLYGAFSIEGSLFMFCTRLRVSVVPLLPALCFNAVCHLALVQVTKEECPPIYCNCKGNSDVGPLGPVCYQLL